MLKMDQALSLDLEDAISCSLPTWDSAVQHVELCSSGLGNGQGHPRYVLQKCVKRLCEVLARKYAKEDETCLCFPTYGVAKRCREYVRKQCLHDGHEAPKVRILQLATSKPVNAEEAKWKKECKIAVIFVHKSYYKLLEEYWRFNGEIISNRLARYVLNELFVAENASKSTNQSSAVGFSDEAEFIEARYGRTMNFLNADKAKMLIRRRISLKIQSNNGNNNDTDAINDEELTELFGFRNIDMLDPFNVDEQQFQNSAITSAIPAEPIDMENALASPLDNMDTTLLNMHAQARVDAERDVFLMPSGMASISTAYRLLLQLDAKRVHRSRSSMSANSPTSLSYYKKIAIFGYPYIDTLKLFEMVNEVHLLGSGDISSIKELEKILHKGEQLLAVFIEVPTNPLLKMGDLVYLKKLADAYGFYIIVDDTIGGFVNIDTLPFADLICGSLTKSFCGDSNVMAGSLVLNPQSRLYSFAQVFLMDEYEDTIWCEDAIFLERDSRDFIPKTVTMNRNASLLLDKVLLSNEGPGKLFRKIYHPKVTSTENYEKLLVTRSNTMCPACYCAVITLEFHNIEQAIKFYNSLQVNKGPLLGTNYTLAFPYGLLAQKDTDGKASEYGVTETLIRVSVGLEKQEYLIKSFRQAIEAC